MPISYSDFLKPSNNLSDLKNALTAWNNLGASESLGSSIGASGWVKLPNGLIIQWISLTVPSQSFTGGTIYSFDMILPITFPNNIFVCLGSLASVSLNSNNLASSSFRNLTNSQVTASIQYFNTVTNSPTFRILAIGN